MCWSETGKYSSNMMKRLWKMIFSSSLSYRIMDYIIHASVICGYRSIPVWLNWPWESPLSLNAPLIWSQQWDLANYFFLIKTSESRLIPYHKQLHQGDPSPHTPRSVSDLLWVLWHYLCIILCCKHYRFASFNTSKEVSLQITYTNR